MGRIHKNDCSPQCYSMYSILRAMYGLNEYTVFQVKAIDQENVDNLNVEDKN